MSEVETVALDEIDLFRAIRRSPSRSNIGIARHLLPILTDIIARERAAALAEATPLIEAQATAAIVAWLEGQAAWHDKHDDGLSGFDRIAQAHRESIEAITDGDHLKGRP